MQRYNVKIKFVADYLQARMSLTAKKAISKTVKKSGAEEPIKANDPKDLMYADEKGCYVPAEQVVGALINSGKDFKIKARKCSYKEFVKAKVFVVPIKIYMGKQSFDSTILTYPKRKDGSRVPLVHPAFNKGLELDFIIECLDETGIDEETLYELAINAGAAYGLGARHPRWGRFLVLKFEKIK